MAKSLTVIRMDYSKAKKQAEQLDTIAKNLKNLANNEMNETVNRISANWKSDYASEYIKKANQEKQELLKQSQHISNAANSLRTIATNVYNAEMKAYNIAKQRSYK